MSDDKDLERAKSAWQSQSVELPQLSIAYLRNRAADHENRGRARRVIEYICGAAAAVMGVWYFAVTDNTWFRVGVVVVLLGVLYALYEARRRRLAWTLRPTGAAAGALEFYRAELARLRDEHRGIWRMHLLGSIPGAVVLLTWAFAEKPGSGWQVIGLAVAVIVWILAMVRHEVQEAKRYRQELDALDSPEQLDAPDR